MSEDIRIIIVEDHEVSRNGLVAGLSAETDITVVGTADTSDDGLALARKERPDVVLLDLHLPGTNGPRTMVKEFCKSPTSKVIVFSVENRPAFIEAVMQQGASAYLLKSESVATVAKTIRQVVTSNQSIVSKQVDAPAKLTRSEQDILRLVAKGMKYQGIAKERRTSVGTIRKQCEMLILKLGLETREELIAWSAQNGYGGLDS